MTAYAYSNCQKRRQKVFNRGALRLCRGAWTQNFCWFIVFHISI